MARGWESKSVEGQIEESVGKKKVPVAPARHITAKPVRISREREALLLAKIRIVKDLETTENPRYHQFLESSLAAIEKQLSETE
jgi:hypothetical protein